MNVGNFVLLNSPQSSSKFSDRWEGPYRVTKITSSENVELMDIKNINASRFTVHVNRVKKIYFEPEDFEVKTGTLRMSQQLESQSKPVTGIKRRGRPPKIKETPINEEIRRRPGKRRGRPPKHFKGKEQEPAYQTSSSQVNVQSTASQKPHFPHQSQVANHLFPPLTLNEPRYNFRRNVKHVNRY